MWRIVTEDFSTVKFPGKYPTLAVPAFEFIAILYRYYFVAIKNFLRFFGFLCYIGKLMLQKWNLDAVGPHITGLSIPSFVRKMT